MNSKFGQFWQRAHLTYLALALLLYGLKAGLYFIIAAIPCPWVTFDMAIDHMIPFIPYFYVFYLSYYILPEIFIWLLSFYNKKKVLYIVFGAVAANILCCIAFLIQNVKMAREPYEAIVAPYANFQNITNIKEFFYACLDFQYKADATALNCFPSLHATFGTMLLLVGVPLSKNERHFPLWARIVSVIFGLGIVMSTFFVKQHYFIDAVAGTGLMIASYFAIKPLVNYVLKKKNIQIVDDEHVAKQ